MECKLPGGKLNFAETKEEAFERKRRLLLGPLEPFLRFTHSDLEVFCASSRRFSLRTKYHRYLMHGAYSGSATGMVGVRSLTKAIRVSGLSTSDWAFSTVGVSTPGSSESAGNPREKVFAIQTGDEGASTHLLAFLPQATFDSWAQSDKAVKKWLQGYECNIGNQEIAF